MAGENPILYSAAKGGIAELQQVARPRRSRRASGSTSWRRASSRPRSARAPTSAGARGRGARRRSAGGARPRTWPARRSSWPRTSRVSDRPDDHGERWSGDVSSKSDTWRSIRCPQRKRTNLQRSGDRRAAKALPGWYYEDGWIRRVYKTDGWPTTLMLVNAVGYLAEAAYHHPDLTVTWGRLTVKLQNHAAGGITDKDFELARKIEEVVLWRPTGRRARGHAEQVGAAGGSDGRAVAARARSVDPKAAPARVLFVTGRLAEPALRRVLEEMAPPFAGRRRGPQDHGRGADDDAVDRPLPRGARRHRPGAAPRAGRGRHRRS